MDKILELLEHNGRLTPAEIAVMLDRDEQEVERAIKACEEDRTILGYRTLINWENTDTEMVIALIELKVTPQRGEGFDKIASYIYQYPVVKTVYLMSGGFDVMVMVEGESMKEVALFVAEKLAPLEGVQSTATHFMLKKYKEEGVIFEQPSPDERSIITL